MSQPVGLQTQSESQPQGLLLFSSDFNSLFNKLKPRIPRLSGRRIGLELIGMKPRTNMIDHSQFIITRESLI